MTCVTCKHYKPGAPRWAGECKYPVIWPAMPKAYSSYITNCEFVRWPDKKSMFRTDGKGCKTYERIVK